MCKCAFVQRGGRGGGGQGDPDELMTPTEAARVLGVSADTVRFYADAGKLHALRTPTGRRFFRRGDVNRFAAERSRNRR